MDEIFISILNNKEEIIKENLNVFKYAEKLHKFQQLSQCKSTNDVSQYHIPFAVSQNNLDIF